MSEDIGSGGADGYWREQLGLLARKLQVLHARLLDVERMLAPGMSAVALLDRLAHDPAWAWLRDVSSLVADIDHVLARGEPLTENDVAVVAGHVRGMLFDEGENRSPEFLARYRPMLQFDPALASVHGELRALLRPLPHESANESERLHARHVWAERCRQRPIRE